MYPVFLLRQALAQCLLQFSLLVVAYVELDRGGFVFWGWWGCFTVFYGVLRCSTVFYGSVLRCSTVFYGSVLTLPSFVIFGVAAPVRTSFLPAPLIIRSTHP